MECDNPSTDIDSLTLIKPCYCGDKVQISKLELVNYVKNNKRKQLGKNGAIMLTAKTIDGYIIEVRAIINTQAIGNTYICEIGTIRARFCVTRYVVTMLHRGIQYQYTLKQFEDMFGDIGLDKRTGEERYFDLVKSGKVKTRSVGNGI